MRTLLRLTSAALPLLALAFVGPSLTGCGDETPDPVDFGNPPDGGAFDPGKGGSDGYGSGGGPTGETPFVCPDELKACPQPFTLPFGGEPSVELRGDFGGPETWEKGVPMTRDGATWKATANVPFGKPVTYKFCVSPNGAQCGEWKHDPAQPTVTDESGNVNNRFAGTTCAEEDSICQDQGELPAGVFDWRDAVIYFVFVDRFHNGNPANDCTIGNVSGGPRSIANYQGGDYAGVTQKINEGYFNQLGVNTLWLTVPLENADVAGRGVGGDPNTYSAYHGYWPKLDSSNPAALTTEKCFGTMNDLKALVTAAHAKGIKILYDYAMVHVHSTSQIVADHGDWFWPNNNGRGGDCICGQGCSWDTLPDRERCWFTDYLPHWNYTNPAARTYSVSNAIEWVKQTGIDGFRADAIKHIDMSWLTELRSRVKTEIQAQQTPQQRFYMVGETYDFGNRDVLKQYVDPNTKLDGQFDFPLRRHVVEALLFRTMKMSDLAGFMNGNDFFYGASAIMSTFVGNHDLPRIIHLAQNAPTWGTNQGADGKDRAWNNQPGLPSEREAFQRVANSLALIFTNRGAPLLYYGDEIGLPGAGDPDNRRFMQWASYSPNQTFLKERISKLLEIRAAHPALRRGVRATVSVSDDVWVYSRVTAGDEVWVAINRSDRDQPASGLPARALSELVTGEDANGGSVTVPAREARIFVAK